MYRFSPNFKMLEIPADQKSQYKKRHELIPFGDINTIDSSKDKVTIGIPTTINTLKVIEIINISNYETLTNSVNAILILLDGNNGKMTNKENPSFILQSTFELKKLYNIGIKEDVLKNHGKLLVIVLHDDEKITENKFLAYKAHVISQRYLNDGTNKYAEIDAKHFAVKSKKPKEEDGSVIFII